MSDQKRPGPFSGIRAVLLFGLMVIGIGSVMTAVVEVAFPFLDFTPWKIFRRCVSIAAGLSLWWLITKREGRSFRSYGFKKDPAYAAKHLKFGLILGAAGLLIMLAIGLLTEVCHIHITPDKAKLWRTLITFLPAAFIVSVLEELVFRGYILQHLLSCSRVFACVFSSVLYALVHLRNTELHLATWTELGGLFILGLVLAFSYLRTQQLYLAVGLHAVLAYGARVNKLLIQFPNHDAFWFIGNSRLVNGIAGWMALLLMGLAIGIWTKNLKLK